MTRVSSCGTLIPLIYTLYSVLKHVHACGHAAGVMRTLIYTVTCHISLKSMRMIGKNDDYNDEMTQVSPCRTIIALIYTLYGVLYHVQACGYAPLFMCTPVGTYISSNSIEFNENDGKSSVMTMI